MGDSNDSKRPQEQEQEKFCVSDGPFHRADLDDDMKEFSGLLARVPAKVLQFELMTHGQRMFAKALWEACNYGGRPTPGDLKNMEPLRGYQEWVLKLDHRLQVNKANKKQLT